MTQANLMKDKHVRVQEDSKVVKLQKANVGSLCEFKTALRTRSEWRPKLT